MDFRFLDAYAWARFKPLGRRKFQIISYGEDGQEGTEDDIYWPENAEEQ